LSFYQFVQSRHEEEAIINPVTVSGISAGGFMATQFHVAFSSKVNGVGILAGGPFYCAMDSEALALSRCMQEPENINVPELVSITEETFATTGTIDDPVNMASAKVWILSAMNDSVVNTGVVQATERYYDSFVSESSQIQAIYNELGEHAFLTIDQGSSPCTYNGSPYINACDFDAAGSILTHLYNNDLVSPNGQNDGLDLGSLVTFDQTAYMEAGYTSETSALNKIGYVYVPNTCSQNNTNCKVHVAFHGCLQTLDDINEDFVTEAGYNSWAAANDIIILYPQIIKTVLNPKGCFDWWGYTGTDYASKLGVQMSAVNGMVNSIDQIIQTR